MNIRSIQLVNFSPTGTSKQIVEAIASGIQTGSVEHLDLTPPIAKQQEHSEFHGELAIIGAPVYGGRLPLDAVTRFQRLNATNTPAVVVVVYGNREYEDALLELRDLASAVGFTPVAGAAFIGEHSFNTEETPIAPGRPDTSDLQLAMNFGARIQDMMRAISHPPDIPPLQVPGRHPYKERGQGLKDISPITNAGSCRTCGTCADVCPTAAITIDTDVKTEPEACIVCCACVKHCPTNARVIEHPRIKKIADWLSTNYSARKEPETYLIS